MKATITSKGQVTIPISIRSRANITTGIQVDFQLEADGTIVIRPIIHDIVELKGIVRSKRPKPVPLEKMKRAIREGAKRAL